MTIHDKLAARLREEAAGCKELGHAVPWKTLLHCAKIVEEGHWDDILGVREPTIEDVGREAVRVYGVAKEYSGALVYYLDNGVHVGVGSEVRGQHVEVYPVIAPTIAAAYQALRALPDHEEE